MARCREPARSMPRLMAKGGSRCARDGVAGGCTIARRWRRSAPNPSRCRSPMGDDAPAGSLIKLGRSTQHLPGLLYRDVLALHIAEFPQGFDEGSRKQGGLPGLLAKKADPIRP